MKKIYSIPLFAILGIAMVSAVVVGYYAMFLTTFTVNSAIEVVDGEQNLGVISSGGFTEGDPITILNKADSERTIFLDEIALCDEEPADIITSYIGSLTLVEKNISTWKQKGVIEETINYTIVGDDFVVEGIPEGYTLIYYPNTEEDVFVDNVANVKVLVEGINDIENLPISLDVGDDYCGNEHNYGVGEGQCVGAKLWLIPGELDEVEARAKVLAWDTTGFLFETELIQYNAEGNIVMSPGSSLIITPVYEIGIGVVGSCVVNTTIA